MVPKQTMIDNVSVYYPRYFRLPGKWFHPVSCYSQYISILPLIRDRIKKNYPDIIYAHSATAPGYIALLLKKKYGIPMICALRGSDINAYPYYDRFSMYMTKKVILEADQLISVSVALKHAANKLATPKKEIKVIYNGCDSKLFAFKNADRIYVRRKYGIAEFDKIILFVGSTVKSKGLFDLLTAFKKIYEKIKNIYLFVIGDSFGDDIVNNFRVKNSSGMAVKQLGALKHVEIPQYFSAADIFVLPSYSEGLPNAMLEAMSCGLPVIGTSVGGIPEILTDGLNGRLVQPGDTDGLTNTICSVLKCKDIARTMGQQGRKIIETQFQWNHNAKEFIDLCESLLCSSISH